MGSQYLPDDVMVEVFRRLPGKSLLHCKRVCKAWYSTISGLKFEFKRALIVSQSKGRVFQSKYGEAIFQEIPTPWQKNENYHMRSPYVLGQGNPYIAGSANGLVLVVIDDSFFLWNPFTKFFRKVLRLFDCNHADCVTKYGFCYDPCTNDYKVLVVVEDQSSYFGGEIVTVTSLKTKCWTEVRFPYHLGSAYKGPFVEGHLHWMARDKDPGFVAAPNMIVHFDPRTNEFNEILIPKPKHRDKNIISSLGDLGGNLCMVCWYNDSDIDGHFEVLVMKEYGVVESWTTLFTISNVNIRDHHKRLVPLCFTRDGEILMNEVKKIVAYNPTYNLDRQVEILNRPKRGVFDDGATYEQTLISPVEYNWDDNEDRELTRRIHYSIPNKWYHELGEDDDVEDNDVEDDGDGDEDDDDGDEDDADAYNANDEDYADDVSGPDEGIVNKDDDAVDEGDNDGDQARILFRKSWKAIVIAVVGVLVWKKIKL